MELLGFMVTFPHVLLGSLIIGYAIQTFLDTEWWSSEQKLLHFFMVWISLIIAFVISFNAVFSIVPIAREMTLFSFQLPWPNLALIWWIIVTAFLGGILWMLNDEKFSQWSKMTNFFIILLFSFLVWKWYVVKILVTG